MIVRLEGPRHLVINTLSWASSDRSGRFGNDSRVGHGSGSQDELARIQHLQREPPSAFHFLLIERRIDPGRILAARGTTASEP